MLNVEDYFPNECLKDGEWKVALSQYALEFSKGLRVGNETKTYRRFIWIGLQFFGLSKSGFTDFLRVMLTLTITHAPGELPTSVKMFCLPSWRIN